MRKRTDKPRRDLHAEITDKLIAAIEANPGQPQMPWRKRGGPLWLPKNSFTGDFYRGINVVNLWVAAETRGFSSPLWASFDQWVKQGGNLKGTKGEFVVYYRNYQTTPNPDDQNDDGTRRVAKTSYVYNADEVQGIDHPPPPETLAPIERIEAVDRFIANTGAAIKIGGDRAFYRPSTDTIHMPAEELFTGTDTMDRRQGFYAVELHELTHWSGAPTRCNRDKHEKFADEIYIREELIAEIASAMLCAELQITQDTRADHAQYLAHWLNLLKDDPKAIFKAAARASEAVTYLKSLQPKADAKSADAPPRERAHAA